MPLSDEEQQALHAKMLNYGYVELQMFMTNLIKAQVKQIELIGKELIMYFSNGARYAIELSEQQVKQVELLLGNRIHEERMWADIRAQIERTTRETLDFYETCSKVLNPYLLQVEPESKQKVPTAL